jgi:hypothetical protein
MPKWRDLWRDISAESEKARSLMGRDPAQGKEQFAALIEKHGEDGMILLNRGKAFQQLGELQLAYSDYLQAEELFPMEEWKDSASRAAAKLEAQLPAHVPDKRLKAGLDSHELDPGVRRSAQEAFRLADLSPAASIQSARTALLGVVRKLGAISSNPRGAIAANYLDQGIKHLEQSKAISEVTANEMHTIQRIRNALEHRSAKVTSHDARACAFVLMAVLRAVSQIRKN